MAWICTDWQCLEEKMSWDSDEKRDANDKTNTSDVSKVYFLLSPEWKTASSEAQKVFLGVFLALYLVSLGLFCYILVEDSNMVHTLKLKAFMNHRPATPLLQKIQMEAKVNFHIFAPNRYRYDLLN